MDFREEPNPPAWLRLAAEETARAAAQFLGLPAIRLKYWRSAPGAPAWTGWTDFSVDIRRQPYVIHLVVDRLPDPEQVRSATAHEARHLWQSAMSRFTGPREAETDACRWARQFTGILPAKRMVGE